MHKVLCVRELTNDERLVLERLIRSGTESVRRVERARIFWQFGQGRHVPAIAADVGVSERTVRLWVKRFNEDGLDGLVDEPRSGHPPTYTAEQASEVIAAALTTPDALGQPFGSWTLDRLEGSIEELVAAARRFFRDLLRHPVALPKAT